MIEVYSPPFLLRQTTNCAPAESISVSRQPAPKHFSKHFSIGKLFTKHSQWRNISQSDNVSQKISMEKLFSKHLSIGKLLSKHFSLFQPYDKSHTSSTYKTIIVFHTINRDRQTCTRLLLNM